MVLKKEVFHVELMPNQCAQQCDHCPSAKKAGEPVVFSPHAVATFDRLMAFVHERAGAISRLIVSGTTPGTMSELPRLSLPVTPEVLSVHCGNLPHGNDPVQAVIDRIDELVLQMNQVFDDVKTPHPYQALNISTTPRFSEEGVLEDTDLLAIAGICLLDAARSKGAALTRFRPEWLDFSLDCNTLPPSIYQKAFVDGSSMPGAMFQTAVVGKICSVIAKRYPRKTIREDHSCSSTHDDFRITVISALHEFDDGFKLMTAMRAIEKPPQLPTGPTPLNKRRSARLGVMFDSRGVWVEHNNLYISDSSVRFTHGEFCELIDATQSSGAWLEDKVYDAIEERRRV